MPVLFKRVGPREVAAVQERGRGYLGRAQQPPLQARHDLLAAVHCQIPCLFGKGKSTLTVAVVHSTLLSRRLLVSGRFWLVVMTASAATSAAVSIGPLAKLSDAASDAGMPPTRNTPVSYPFRGLPLPQVSSPAGA